MPEEKFNYGKYLASREWAILKERVRARSFGFCERCAVGNYEETHHVTYERVGHERLEDLLATCRPCHAFLSAKSDVDPCADVRTMVIAYRRSTIGDLVFNLVGKGFRVVGVPATINFFKEWISRSPDWAKPEDRLD